MGVIRSLMIRLGIQADTKKINDVERRVDDVAQSMREAATAAKQWRTEMAQKFTVATIAAAAGIGVMANAAIDGAAKVGFLAESLGVSTDELQGLAFAAEGIGFDLQTMHDTMQTLGERAKDSLLDPASDAAKQIKQLGIEVKDANGALLDNTTLFLNMADALTGVENETERAARAMTLLGDDGVKLLPILNDGSEALREQIRASKEAGRTLDEDLIKSAQAAGGEIQIMQAQLARLRTVIVLELLPGIRKVVGGFNGWISSGNNAAKATKAVVIATKALAAALAVVVAMKARLLFATLAGAASQFALALKAVVAGLFAMNKRLLAAAILPQILFALVILLQDIFVWLTGGESLVGDFIDRWAESDNLFGSIARWLISIKPVLQDMLAQGIAFAQRVLPPLVAMLQQVAQIIIAKVLPVVQKLAAHATATIMRTIDALQNFFLPLLEEIVTALLDAADELLPVILDLVSTIQTEILGLVVALLPVFMELFNAVIEVAKSLLPLVASLIKTGVKLVSSLLKAIIPVVANLIKIVVKIIVALIPVVTQVIKVVIKVVNFIVPIITKVFTAVAGLVSKALPLITKVMTKVVNTVQGTIDFITPIISGVILVVGKVLKFISDGIDTVVGVIGPVVTGFVSFWNGLVSFMSPIIDAVGGLFETVLGPIVASVGWILDGIREAKNFASGGVPIDIDNINAAMAEMIAAESKVKSGIASSETSSGKALVVSSGGASRNNSVNVNSLQVQVQSVNNDPAEIARKAREGVSNSLGDLQRRQAARDLAAGG